MMSILEELYKGNVCPEMQIIPKNKEYSYLNKKIAHIMEMLEKKLSKDDYYQLETLLDLHIKLGFHEASESFSYGFRLGTMLMIEVLAEKEDSG